MKLLDNTTNNHQKYVNKVISSSEEIYILVAFLKQNGLVEIIEKLKKIIDKKSKIEIIIGLDLYITDPISLFNLYKIMKECKDCNLYIYKSKTGTFHPKIYAGKKGENTKVVVGSANLTAGGLKNNIEASIYQSTKNNNIYNDIKKMFDNLLKKNQCKQANLLNLSQYKKDHSIFSNRVADASSDASSEIDESFTLDLDNIQEYLDEYQNQNDVAKEWSNRQENYEEAKNILNLMLELDFKNSEEFLEYYGLLVGTAGKGQLWHSGSINRLKNRVAENYEIFMLMLDDLKLNIGSDSKEMFSIAEPYVEQINGLGYNVVTEILATYAAEQYPILNNNPLTSIKYLGFSGFKNAGSFKRSDYQNYTDFMVEFAAETGFENLLQADHFLNYIYWEYT